LLSARPLGTGPRILGKIPQEVWHLEPNHCFTDSGIVLVLDTVVTAICLFFPLHFYTLWPVVLGTPLLHLVAWTVLGSSHESPEVEISHSLALLILATFALLGKKRMEVQERMHFAQVHGLTAKVENLNDSVSQLETHNSAMRALMGTVCDVVFHADSDLRVVGECRSLDDLLGPMKGRKLQDRLLDKAQRERFNTVISPVKDVDVGLGSSNPSKAVAVLVPTVKFLSPKDLRTGSLGLKQSEHSEQSSAKPCYGFEAEILVADTGQLQHSAEDRWRYLVGLKGLSYLKLRLAEGYRDTNGHGAPSLLNTAASGSTRDRQHRARLPSGSSGSSAHVQASVASETTFTDRSSTCSVEESSAAKIWPIWAKAMPSEILQNEIKGLMSRLPCTNNVCCRWHAALEQVLRCTLQLKVKHKACRTLWFPSFGWQCGACFSLNDADSSDAQDERECANCGDSTVLAPPNQLLSR
jgi:hypothetical protein